MAPPHPALALPAALAPSVEEAYRRKCIQLRLRTREVEETNDAARLRLERIKRQVLKLRLERAFLLEQLARRTSTNVEDSDGSPSPPPAPEEKPLRSKRGHRKPSLVDGSGDGASSNSKTAGAGGILNNSNFSFLDKNPITGSPAPSESYTGIDPKANGATATGASTNNAGTPAPGGAADISLRPPRRPGTAFEIYCADTRSLGSKPVAPLAGSPTPTPGSATPNIIGAPSGGFTAGATAKPAAPSNFDDELTRGWKGLSDDARDEYKARHAREMEQYEKESEEYAAAKEVFGEDERSKSLGDDDDVEMENDDYKREADD